MLFFGRELPDLHAACRLSAIAVAVEVATLAASLRHIEFELTAVRTSSASQEANFRLLDLTHLNELCMRSSFDLPKSH